jgi:polyhydroxybutyrate depolymerase
VVYNSIGFNAVKKWGINVAQTFKAVTNETSISFRRSVALIVATAFIATSLCLIGNSHDVVGASGATRTPGCTSSTASSATLLPKIGGVTRTVIVHAPSGLDNSKEHALVLNLHGSGSTALEQEGFTGMDATADTNRFIVAYPQALIPDGTGYDWNVPGVPLTGGRVVPANAPNDIAFLTSLVGVLEHRYCINPLRVYATGFSGGARESSQLACDDSTLFAAVAPVSGLRRPTPCPTQRSVPILTFHGSADPIDPFAGNGQEYWTYSVATAEKYWASQDRCASKPKNSTHSGVKLTTYAGCSGGATVSLYEIYGEGHEWPGGPTLPSSITSFLGPQSNAINADVIIWGFFKAHQL